ncbi:MAG: hypothetical protein KAX10_00090 [Candidatus Lokiarchaeota archaeon]|nr:hypothetical protein [Candidatus Lokiarchaeota archaeon]
MTPNNLSYQKNDTYIESPFNDKKDNPSMSQTDLDNPIYGDGLNQTVRAYMNNISTSTMTNGSFNITAPNLYSKLTAGEFNFTFDQNYNTTYEIEDDDVYNYPIVTFPFKNATKNLIDGTTLEGNLSKITDGNIDTFWLINSTTSPGVINLTITANYTSSKDSFSFNYYNISRIDVDLTINLTNDVYLTVKIWDNLDFIWKNISSDIFINSSDLSKKTINLDLINKNLRYINSSGNSTFQFYFRNTTYNFNLSFYEFEASASSAFGLSITNETYVALEFDLRGNATIYGFQTWIRALNLSAALNSNLTISLLRANDTVLRSQITGDGPPAENILIKPEVKIYSYNLTGYINDTIIYFDFDNPKGLNVSNYFIEIKSNISTDAFHLMTLPQTAPFPSEGYDHDDNRNDHILLKTEDNGISWEKFYRSDCALFDASPFIINVTRGWMPNDILNITFENKTLSNMEISTYPYNESSTYTWGLGKWMGEFEEPINTSNGAKFEITLNWNKSVTSHLFFNVSYSATAYSLENATAHYNCTYNGLPKWELNYTFDNDTSYFINWSFLEFWYIYPLYWSSYDLLCADNISKYDENSAGTLIENGLFGKYIVQNDTIIDTSNPDHNGIYSLKLNSSNCIYNMTTYLHFKNSHSWPTKGFMLGDNVSISLNVQDHDGKPVSDGMANASLFLPNGTKFDIWNLTDIEGIIDSTFNVTSYDFNNSNIFNSTFLSEKGSYTIGFFWKNGTAVGCKKKIIYLSDYDFNILDCTYDKEEGGNIFEGNLIRANTDLTNYSILITTVKESTGINTLDKFTINNIISEQFSNVDNLTVEITNFLQNETIISPDEKISFKIKVKNKDLNFPFNVRLSIQLISPINPNWIIAEVNTPNQLLNFTGTPNDSYEFYYNATLNNKNPDGTWNGINSPIRLGGCLTKIKVYIEDEFSGSWINNDYSIMIKDNETVFEGEILSFKYLEGITSRGLVLNFSRDDFNIPGITSFFINIIDEYYMSTLNQINKAFSFKLDSSFQNLSVNPSEVIWGKKFNLTAYLRNEKGGPISGEEIHYYFLNSSNNWQELLGTDGDNHNLTDLNGKAIMEIDSNQFTKNSSGKIKLNWTGNSYILSSEINYTIDFIIYSNEIILESVTNNTIFLRNKENQMDIIIKNVGTSILTDINITLITNFSYTLSKYNNYELNYLKPEETTGISYLISIPNIDDNNITILVNISFKTIQTNEENEFQNFLTYDLDDESLFTQIVQLSILFLFIGIGCFYLLALLYRVRINKKIEKIFEKPPERKRKGKYVKVSELRAKEIEKKDLDELLKEEKIK